ncbi:hypothetical protein [Bradyrhizobium sp. UNPA324]|uniref:hypothetical protein n=1 Tax=Bradyrhizobium sp. UNPA324 TaxID=1141174 RepID=UPI0011685CDC|nr:hypothetical protein [Bradyrhizobium sp. UNPA324]TQF29729.1 hypothetical protein UNPA324_08940 [Bradyrhizobium sp. UNPA324]
MHNRSFGNTGPGKRDGLALRIRNGWHRVAATFARDDDYLPFATLIWCISAVAAVLFLISWLYIAAKISAIDLGLFPSPPTTQPLSSSAIHFS